MNEAQVYIVHVWSSTAPPAGFRAAVRAVDKDEGRLFTDARLLASYLIGELAIDPCQTAAGHGHSNQARAAAPKG